MKDHRIQFNSTISNQNDIRILHIVLSLEPGGMENGVVNVSRVLHDNGFSIYACCLERAGDFANKFPGKDNIFVLNKRPGISFKTIFKLSSVVRKIRPNVVHTHNLGPLIYISAAKCLTPKFSLLHGEHGMIKNEDNTKSKIVLRRFLYSRCNLVHTVSAGLRDYFMNLGFPADKIISISNGVDTQVFKPSNKLLVRKELNLPAKAIILGTVARFDRGKRHYELIEAFNSVASNFHNLYLLFVGEGGTDCNRVKEIAKSSPYKDRIILAGYQRNTAPFYQAMDLLVIPSLKEGFPNVLLEAMACGVPVLAHPTPGTTEAVENNVDGILSNLETVETIKESIAFAVSNIDMVKKLGENARRKIEMNFSLEKMADNYAIIYKKLCWLDSTG